LLTSVFGTRLKDSKLSNYSLKKSNILIFNALNTRIFKNIYYFVVLKQCSGDDG